MTKGTLFSESYQRQIVSLVVLQCYDVTSSCYNLLKYLCLLIYYVKYRLQ